MSLDADAIVDRRRMRRKLTFWRAGALLIALLALVGFAAALVPGGRLVPSSNYIARIRVEGLIRDNQDRVDALERLAKSRARAVIVHINSPGGTTAGSEQLYDSLRALQAAEADGGGGRWTGRFRRLYRGARLRSHHRAGHLAGRLDRRAVPVPQLHRGAQNHRHPGRGDKIVAAQGGAQRLRADQPGRARCHRRDRHRLLCLVQGPGEGPPQDGRHTARRGGRWARLHRPPGRAA